MYLESLCMPWLGLETPVPRCGWDTVAVVGAGLQLLGLSRPGVLVSARTSRPAPGKPETSGTVSHGPKHPALKKEPCGPGPGLSPDPGLSRPTRPGAHFFFFKSDILESRFLEAANTQFSVPDHPTLPVSVHLYPFITQAPKPDSRCAP